MNISSPIGAQLQNFQFRFAWEEFLAASGRKAIEPASQSDQSILDNEAKPPWPRLDRGSRHDAQCPAKKGQLQLRSLAVQEPENVTRVDLRGVEDDALKDRQLAVARRHRRQFQLAACQTLQVEKAVMHRAVATVSR